MEEIKQLLVKMEEDDQHQRDRGLDRSNRWRSVPRQTGQFLYQTVMIHQPRVIVEIGLSHGYSTMWLGLAAKQVKAVVESYEIVEWRYNKAVENITKAHLDDVISPNLVSEDFEEYPEEIDLVFIDAEKSDYLQHFKNIEKQLSVNGIVIADNTISHAEELKQYVEYVRASPKYFSVSVPVGKGLELTRKAGRDEINLIPAMK